MTRDMIHPRPLRQGEYRVAVLSPSWAVPADYPAVHEQAMRRLRETVGVEPVELATTRRHSAAKERADDLNAAFADPSIRAILATIGGDDQITVLPHLNPALALANPKPFIGYSDNTNLLNWCGSTGWHRCTEGRHRSTSAPARASTNDTSPLRAALFGGEFTRGATPQQRHRP